VSVPTATRMIQQLEAKGLVSHWRSPADQRQIVPCQNSLITAEQQFLADCTALRYSLTRLPRTCLHSIRTTLGGAPLAPPP
jgi:hypothetical protein